MPKNYWIGNNVYSGDQLAIGKETGRRLGMGTNMYPSSALLGQNKDESIVALPVDELIEKADGFAGVFPGTVISIHFLESLSISLFLKVNTFFLVFQSTSMRLLSVCKQGSIFVV